MRLVSADHRRRSLPALLSGRTGERSSPGLWPNGGRALATAAACGYLVRATATASELQVLLYAALMLFFIAGLSMAGLNCKWHVDALMRRAGRGERHLARRFWRLLSHQQTARLLRRAGPGYA